MKATHKEVSAAREIYGGPDVEIDIDALASHGEDGTWVQAWVFLSNAELRERGITEEEGDE